MNPSVEREDEQRDPAIVYTFMKFKSENHLLEFKRSMEAPLHIE